MGPLDFCLDTTFLMYSTTVLSVHELLSTVHTVLLRKSKLPVSVRSVVESVVQSVHVLLSTVHTVLLRKSKLPVSV